MVMVACIVVSISLHAAIISYISGKYSLAKVSPRQGSPVITVSLAPLEGHYYTGSRKTVLHPRRPPRAIKRVVLNKGVSMVKHADHSVDQRARPLAEEASGHVQEKETGRRTGKVFTGKKGGSPAVGSFVTARPAGSIKPVYPRYCRIHHQEGRVVLMAKVGPGGEVLSVYMKRSSGVQQLDEAALTALRNARFIPATKDGMPVTSTVEETFIFRLEDHPGHM